MKKLALFLVLLPFIALSQSGPYSRVKFAAAPKEFRALARSGVALDHLHKTETGFSGEFSKEETETIFRICSSATILVADLEKDFLLQNARRQLNNMAGIKYNTPYGFGYGSMGGYLTYTEAMQKIDSMILLYPNLISAKMTIGKSVEGRDMMAFKISDYPNTDEGEPEVLYTALHHAREPMSMMQMIYYMFYLLENYGKNQELTKLIDGTEMYFVPFINPDGYLYNESTNPAGGGFWRKNRRFNEEDSTYGVDLNRNYGTYWAYDEEGSSSFGESNNYRGTQPFSEPETQAIKEFCKQRQFLAALNYHSYSNVLIYPYGYSFNSFTPDSLQYKNFAALLTEENGYMFGNCYETLGYIANGTSDDWMYDEQTEKNKIVAFTPEVGERELGFWPPKEYIIPYCEMQVQQNINLVKIAQSLIATGLQSSDSEELMIYPNPSSGTFIVTGEAETIQVFDMTGRILARQQLTHEKTVHLPKLSNGLYLLRLTGPAKNFYSTKIIINN